MVGNFKKGDKVKVASNNDNENYNPFRNKTLTITEKATSSKQHPGFDDGMKGEALYSFVDKDGNDIPFSLYDYELESVKRK